MANKLLYIPNDDLQDYPSCIFQFKHLDTKPSELNNQKSHSSKNFKANEYECVVIKLWGLSSMKKLIPGS